MAEVMAEQGYVNTPVAAIIKRAGVSRETFYQQFSPSRTASSPRSTRPSAGSPRELTAALAAPGTPVERFELLLGHYLDALAADPPAARLFLIESYAAGPEVLARRVELHQQFVDGLAALIGAETDGRPVRLRGARRGDHHAGDGAHRGRRAADLHELRAPLVELVAHRAQLIVTVAVPRRRCHLQVQPPTATGRHRLRRGAARDRDPVARTRAVARRRGHARRSGRGQHEAVRRACRNALQSWPRSDG